MGAPALILLLLRGSAASVAEPFAIGEIDPLTGAPALQASVFVQIQNGRHMVDYPTTRPAAPIQLPAR